MPRGELGHSRAFPSIAWSPNAIMPFTGETRQRRPTPTPRRCQSAKRPRRYFRFSFLSAAACLVVWRLRDFGRQRRGRERLRPSRGSADPSGSGSGCGGFGQQGNVFPFCSVALEKSFLKEKSVLITSREIIPVCRGMGDTRVLELEEWDSQGPAAVPNPGYYYYYYYY